MDDLSAMLAAGQPLDSRKERLISRKILHLLTQHRAGGSGVPDAEREALVLQGAQLLQEYSLVASPESMALFLQPVLDLCQPSLTVNRDGVQSSRRISKRLCAWLCSHVGGAVESASHGPETYCPPSACDRSSSDDECDDINLRISRENSEKNRVVAAGGAQAAADAAAARLRGLRLLARLVSSGVDLTPTVIVDIVSTLFKDLALPPPAVSGKRGSSIELHPSASETLTTPGQRDSPPRPALSSSSKLGCSYGAWRVLTALAARPPLRLALLAAVVRYWHLHGFDAQRHGLAVRVFVFIGECAGTDGARDGARTLISYLQHISSGCTKSFDSPCGRADACADALATAGVRSNCSTLLQHLLLMTSCLGLLAELLGGDAPADADDAAGLALERDAQGLLAVVYFVVSQARVGRIPDRFALTQSAPPFSFVGDLTRLPWLPLASCRYRALQARSCGRSRGTLRPLPPLQLPRRPWQARRPRRGTCGTGAPALPAALAARTKLMYVFCRAAGLHRRSCCCRGSGPARLCSPGAALPAAAPRSAVCCSPRFAFCAPQRTSSAVAARRWVGCSSR